LGLLPNTFRTNLSAMKLPNFPVEIARGNCRVRIYSHRAKGKYREFKIAHYVRGKRRLESLSAWPAARKRAKQILAELEPAKRGAR